MAFLGIVARGLFYAISIALVFPVLLLFRVEERAPGVDDGFDIGYDDDDPGKDVDE